MSAAETKACPFCAETIKAAAVLCRFCGSELPPSGTPAAAIAAAAPQAPFALVHRPEVLDLLTALVQKSLVLYEEDEQGQGRYRLLETTRQYARDLLLEAGEETVVHERHRDWFLGLAEQASSYEQPEAEHDNLRAALQWTAAEGQGEVGLRLGGALGEFWNVRSHWTEGREHLARLLTLPGAEARTAARARALQTAGLLAFLQWDSAAARALYEESLAIFREIEDERSTAHSLGGLGNIARLQGHPGAARALYEESLAIFRRLEDQHGIAWSLGGLANVAYHQGEYGAARIRFEESLAIFRQRGDKHGIAYVLGGLGLGGLGYVARDEMDYGAARALFEERLAIFQELGSKEGIAYALGALGMVAHDQGDLGAAQALYEEGLAIFQGRGNRFGVAGSLHGLGLVARDQGRVEAARTLLGKSLAIFRELSHKRGIVEDLEGLAAVAVAQAQPERAARLFGTAEALREAMGAPLPPADRAEHERRVAAVRAALGEAGESEAGGPCPGFAAAWAEGRAMLLPQAVEYALRSEGASADG